MFVSVSNHQHALLFLCAIRNSHSIAELGAQLECEPGGGLGGLGGLGNGGGAGGGNGGNRSFMGLK